MTTTDPAGRGALTVSAGPQTMTFQPGKTVTVGRTPDCDVTVNDPLVSRLHSVIEFDGARWQLTDRSTNGVFAAGNRVPGVTVTGTVAVRLGDPRTGPELRMWPAATSGGTPPQAPPSRGFPSQGLPARPPSQGTPPRPTPPPPSQGFPSQGLPSQGLPSQGLPSTPTARPAPAPSNPGPQRLIPSNPPGGGGAVAPHLRAMAGNTGLIQVARRPEGVRQSGVQTIGRTPENDYQVEDMLVSRRHAQLTHGPQGVVITDLHSANGTQVNGRRIAQPVPLRDGDVITVGNSDLVLRGTVLERPQVQKYAGAGLSVHGVSLTVEGDKTLLNGVRFTAAPGTLTAIIGPSGAGKSTVSRVVSGAVRPTQGTVEFEGRNVHRDFDALRSRIGMVPQDDVLHRQLTLQQALRYAAELRLPPDTSAADRDQVIDGVLAELQLTEHKKTRVDRLSGGQRKRASVAMELLTGPSLLILDEPTSGLDPALDRQVMQTLRSLADAGRVVIVVTHSLTYINMCDQVLLLAPGGKTSYCGSPKGVGAAMGTTDWAEIFDFVAKQPDAAWHRYLTANPAPPVPPPAPPAPGKPSSAPTTSVAKQLSVVARRQLQLILADRGYLIFLLLMPIALGAITLIVPSDDGLRALTTMDNASGPSTILVLLAVGACFMGAALTARDLVGERAIFHRERAVGLRPGAYLAAKSVVFFIAATVQVAIMVGIVLVAGLGPAGPGAVLPSAALELFVDIAVLACVSTLVGLLISAFAKSSEQVMPLLVVVVMVQLVMSGGLFALANRLGLEQASWLFPSRWGYASGASTIDLQHIGRIPVFGGPDGTERVHDLDDPSGLAFKPFPTPDGLYDHTAARWGQSIGIMAAMGLGLWLITWRRITRK